MDHLNRLLIRMWGVLEEEDPSSVNYQIARKLIRNIASIDNTSTEGLARLCNVSKPSISRFCKNLGYEDFYDFRAELNQYYPDQGSKYIPTERQKMNGLMRGFLEDVQSSLERMDNEDFERSVEELAKDICQYKQVYLVGNMQSGKTAESLWYNLHVVKKNISAVTSFHGQINVFNKCRPGTLIVVFSVSGGYFRALFPVGEAPKRPEGAKVWLVTTNPAIRKLEGVDAMINCGTGTSLAESSICLEAAANLLAMYYWNDV